MKQSIKDEVKIFISVMRVDPYESSASTDSDYEGPKEEEQQPVEEYAGAFGNSTIRK